MNFTTWVDPNKDLSSVHEKAEIEHVIATKFQLVGGAFEISALAEQKNMICGSQMAAIWKLTTSLLCHENNLYHRDVAFRYLMNTSCYLFS